ncbi:MAG: response regulator transcription factor [Actinomycetota bacterium]|nr:response regulator transcription factor [Actinomycetota bacterium]
MDRRVNDPERPIRVLLADDQTMFREGLASLLASRGTMEIAGEAPDGEGAIALAKEKKPDVVVTQVEMPVERAKEYLSEMLKVSPESRVVIVTRYRSPRLVQELMGTGASAYLLKSASVEALIGAIRAAAVNPDEPNLVVGIPRETFERAMRGESGGLLTDRQTEVLILAARGLSNRDIASRLHISERTVHRHLANVYEKMRVNSRGEAAKEAISRGLFSLHDVAEDVEE